MFVKSLLRSVRRSASHCSSSSREKFENIAFIFCLLLFLKLTVEAANCLLSLISLNSSNNISVDANVFYSPESLRVLPSDPSPAERCTLVFAITTTTGIVGDHLKYFFHFLSLMSSQHDFVHKIPHKQQQQQQQPQEKVDPKLCLLKVLHSITAHQIQPSRFI